LKGGPQGPPFFFAPRMAFPLLSAGVRLSKRTA
jgi:hypothetical protein